MNKYTPIIGLEVHVELKTKSKMFCSCDADYFGKEPNTHVCPVCLGLPGALPVPNKVAIEWCVMIATALNCTIAEFSKFDRKNYFYPDLPKGYQISQYDLPFGEHGSVKLSTGKTIRIRRVHMEEDTGKLTHSGDASLVDFNRSGLPLVEIVTEPDFNDASEVVEYLKKLQQIVRYLDVSNADMEKGDMRLEPNISLRAISNKQQATSNLSLIADHLLPPYKVEVKNINSFRFVEKAIQFEIKRQSEILEEGQTPIQETRGWNEARQNTFSQRIKEEAHDYRYFPEPDIPPIRLEKSYIAEIKSHMPELPDAKFGRFVMEYKLSEYDAEILTRERTTADFFESAVTIGKEKSITPKQIANAIINKKVDIAKASPTELVATIVASTQAIPVDEKALTTGIEKALQANQKAVEDYKSGKESVIMYLVGQVMKNATSRLDAKVIRDRLEKELKQ